MEVLLKIELTNRAFCIFGNPISNTYWMKSMKTY